MSEAVIKAIKGRRKNWGKLPVPAERADLFWSKRERELAGITDGLLTALLLLTPEFQALIGAALDRIDERNQTGYGHKMGRPSRWSAWQLETVLLYRRIAGIEDVKLALTILKTDLEARQLLGFADALPSAPTITRHLRKHFDPVERVTLYLELDRELRRRVVQLPGFDEEARILGMDGSQHGTHYTAPIPEAKDGKTTGKIVNADKKPGEAGAITAPTAGYVGGNHAKSGRGWQLLGLFTEHGTPVSWEISPLNEAETKAAQRVIASYASEVKQHRHLREPSVCTADAGFDSNALREQLQGLGIVPNIHRASHKKDFLQPDEETENASKRNGQWRPFRHPTKKQYENWGVNGHGELSCTCGSGVIKREFPMRQNGSVTPVTKGHCQDCRDVTITSSQWRLASHQTHITRSDQGDTPDPLIGNSLTFNDPLSREYGQDRYGFNESIHATMERRFGLLQDRSWMRDIEEVKTEFAIAFSAISVLLLERDARRQAATPTPITQARSASEALPLAA
jgi:hypothetical protein